MKKLILTVFIILLSITNCYSAADPGGPPCTAYYPYTSANKTRDQVKYGWYNDIFWAGIWPARQATCQDWFYIWQPANNFLGYWQQAGYVWIADSSYFGGPRTITGFMPGSQQVWLEQQRTWYDHEFNYIIGQTAQLLNSRNIWWTWRQ